MFGIKQKNKQETLFIGGESAQKKEYYVYFFFKMIR